MNLQKATSDGDLVYPWKYNIRKNNIRKNVNSDFTIVTMRRVAIIFFELAVVKNLMIIFLYKNCAWLQQFYM